MSASNTSKHSGTDWDRLDAMSDREIDTSESPELTDDWFARSRLRAPGGLQIQGEGVASEFRKALWEHVSNVSRLHNATTWTDRTDAMKSVEETFRRLLAFPSTQMTKDDHDALKRVETALK